MKILILNGPNLNLQGQRETQHYGAMRFEEAFALWQQRFAGHTLEMRQSNLEGELIDWLHGARGEFDGVVLNAGGYTHTSVALRDAVAGIAPLPVVEVHISNVAARESFRHTSLLTPVCRGLILGLGLQGYELAIEALLRRA